jgi:diguanylate cyclase (GGDEF)-like protein
LIFTNVEYPRYVLEAQILEGIGLFNILAFIAAVLFMQFQTFIEGDKLRKRLEEITEIDGLTGAYNRRFFNKYLDIEVRRLESQIKYLHAREVNFGIAMIDIDNFKAINDKYGHLFGDIVIAEVAHLIKAVIFERDIFCRYGGEEFVALFTTTSKAGTLVAIRKILKTVANYEFRINQDTSVIHVTVSIGFASFDEESNIYRLLDLADKRLYTAKKMGKNTVVSEELVFVYCLKD